MLALCLIDGILTLEGEKLGIVWEPEKDLAGRRIVSLGAMIMAPELKMKVQHHKAVSYATFIQQNFLDHKTTISKSGAGRKILQKLRGRLGYVAQMSRWANLFLTDIDRVLYPGGGLMPEQCRVPDVFWEVLEQFWMPFLQDCESHWLECSKWEVLPHSQAVTYEHEISISDASGHLGGGAVSAYSDYFKNWNDLDMELHITFKELDAAISGIEQDAERYKNKKVMLESDNKAAISYINRARGRDKIGLGMLFRLAWLCIRNRIRCRARHQPGNAMKAFGTDDLSRGRKGTLGRNALPFNPALSPVTDLSHLRKAQLAMEGIETHPGPEDMDKRRRRVAAAWEHYRQVEGDGVSIHADVLEEIAQCAKRGECPTSGGPHNSTDDVEGAECRSLRYQAMFDKLRRRRESTLQGKESMEQSGSAVATDRRQSDAMRRMALGYQPHKKIQGCRACGERAESMQSVRCTSCFGLWHRQCVGMPESVKTKIFQCGKCLVGGSGVTDYGDNCVLSSSDLGLNAASALMVQAQAGGTAVTYDSSVKSVIKLIQQGIQRRSGQWVPEHIIMPKSPKIPMPVEFILSYLGDAVAVYKTQTIAGHLSAVANLHNVKSRGQLPSPTHDWRVVKAMEGLRRVQGGTDKGVIRAAFALPIEVVEMLVDTATEMAHRAVCSSDLRQAYGHARDALWYTLTFLATLRKKETVQLRTEDITAGAVADTYHVFVSKSKADQASVGVSLVVAGCTSSGALNLNRQLALLFSILKQMNVQTNVLFGHMDDPTVPLAAAGTFLERMQAIYLKELEVQGLSIPDGLRLSGHSFRRGGICAIRDAARARGVAEEALKGLLLRHGRWRDERSLLVYLVDNWQVLAGLTAGL